MLVGRERVSPGQQPLPSGRLSLGAMRDQEQYASKDGDGGCQGSDHIEDSISRRDAQTQEKRFDPQPRPWELRGHARITSQLAPAHVARALMPAGSRLVSTLLVPVFRLSWKWRRRSPSKNVGRLIKKENSY